MGFDIKEILDDINPSKKALKWMVICLFTLLSGLLAYEGLKSDNSDLSADQDIKISNLQNKLTSLQIKYKDLTSKLMKINENIGESNLEVKSYVDERIKFVVSNSDKNKQYVLDVLEMSNKLKMERQANTEKSIEVYSVKPDDIETHNDKPANINRVNNDSSSNISVGMDSTIKEVIIEDDGFSIPTEKPDTIKKPKKGFLKKILSIF